MRDYNINSLFYSELLQGFTKLKNDFDLDDITVSKVFLNLLSVSSETFIRSFQLKLLDDIVFTNKRLAKIGYNLHDGMSKRNSYLENCWSSLRFECIAALIKNNS